MMRGCCSERLGFTAFTGWQTGQFFFGNMRTRDLESKLRAQNSRGLNMRLSTSYCSRLLQSQRTSNLFHDYKQLLTPRSGPESLSRIWMVKLQLFISHK